MSIPEAPAPIRSEPRARSRRRTALAVALALAIFVSGGVIGATIAFQSVSKRQERLSRNPVQASLAAMEQKLELSAEQKRKVEVVLERHRAEFEASRREMGEIYQAMHRDIEAILTPAQREEYQAMLQHLRRRGMGSRGNRPGDGDGRRGGGRPGEPDGRRGDGPRPDGPPPPPRSAPESAPGKQSTPPPPPPPAKL